jgi:hypothetical protein
MTCTTLRFEVDRDELALSPDALTPLQALRELARSVAEDSLDEVLETVSNALHRTAGFGEVAVSVYRPDWDDFYGLIVKGSEDAREALIGGVTPRAIFSDFGRYGREVAPGVFFLDGSSELWLIAPTLHTPDRAEYDHPDAWRTDDGLVVTLDDADGGPLGLVSLDEPDTERRPTTEQLWLVEVICSYAEQALRSAERSRRLAHERAILTQITEIAPKISRCGSRHELYGLVSSGVVPALGFERVAVYAAGRPGTLRREAQSGWDLGDAELFETLDAATIGETLSPDRERAGCWLMPAITLLGGDGPPRSRSRRNGYGPRAWSDHCLAIPWRHHADDLAGLVVAEDPIDRLLPEPAQLQALRLLVDHAAAIERAITPPEGR